MAKDGENYKQIIEDLRLKYEECLETLQAIRTGNLDAVVIQDKGKDKVYTLKDAHLPYRLMVENMSEGALSLSPDGLVYYCNQQVSDMLGVSLERLLGSNISNFIKSQDQSRFNYFLKSLEKEKGKIEIEMVARPNREARFIPVFISGNVLRQKRGRLVVAVVTDLREHKRQEKIMASEWFSRTIMEQAADIILVTDSEGIILRASRKAMSLAYTKRMLEGSHIDIFFKNFAPVSKAVLGFESVSSNTLKNGTAVRFAENDTTRNFILNYNAIIDSGEKIGYSIALTEVTGLMRAQQQVKELNQFLNDSLQEIEMVYNLTPVPMMVLDNRLRYVRVNKKLADITGLAIGDHVGKRMEEIAPDFAETGELLASKVLEDGKPILNIEVSSEINAGPGERRYWLTHWYPLKNKQGEAVNVITVLIETTEQKKAERLKMRAFQNKILNMERKRIARELHDTVTQTLFSSNCFLEKTLKLYEKDHEGVLETLKKVRELNSAAFSEIRILLYDLMPKKISDTTLKDSIGQLLVSGRKQSGIKMELEAEGDYDPDQNTKYEFFLIAQEALNNIVKHSKATEVKVHLILHPSDLAMMIEDNGIGFDAANNSSIGKYGLHIMEERAKLAKALLDIDSRPERGTVIKVAKR